MSKCWDHRLNIRLQTCGWGHSPEKTHVQARMMDNGQYIPTWLYNVISNWRDANHLATTLSLSLSDNQRLHQVWSRDYKSSWPAFTHHVKACTSRSGLVVKFVLAMHEPRVRFTAATIVLSFGCSEAHDSAAESSHFTDSKYFESVWGVGQSSMEDSMPLTCMSGTKLFVRQALSLSIFVPSS